jgi:hypothetical protein
MDVFKQQEQQEQQSQLIFTRYLYVKDEVIVALLVSILNKSDDAIYWAYELYHSGFKQEFFNLIWKIYYDFFATLNPAFETYLLKTYKNWLKINTDTIVSSFISNLLCRPFNTDVFMLRNICENFEVEINYNNGTTDYLHNLEYWILNNDYRSLSQWFLNENKQITCEIVYEQCLNIFEKHYKLTKTTKSLLKEFSAVSILNIKSEIILLSKIMTLFSYKNNLKRGKSLYVSIDEQEIVQYETLLSTAETQLKHYNILKYACICGIDDLKHLSLFKLKRHKHNLRKEYYYNWLYHAAFSPLWIHRLTQFNGHQDFIKKQVIFNDEDLEQSFYDNYGYEPDEQSLTTQNKNIMEIQKEHNWHWFYKSYKNNGLVSIYEEELDAFDEDGLAY